jgi:hypothetical protein
LNTFPLGSLPILTVAQLQQINANVAAARGITFNPLSGLQLVTIGDGLKNPRSFQWGFGFERQVATGFTVGATFDYVNTVHLNHNRDYDINVPFIRTGDLSLRPFYGFASTTNTRAVDQRNRPITQLGNAGYVQVRESSSRSLYRALSLRAEYRTKHADFNAFYVLSKNLDDDSTERGATFAEYDNSFNLKPEYNFSRLDRRHQFSFGGVFRAPLGFQISGTGRVVTAAPIDVSVSGIIAPAGSGLSNAQYAALHILGGFTTGDLNQDAGNFSDRPYSAPGVSTKRNSFRNLPLYSTNLRIQRGFRLGERVEIAPSFEVFNVFKFKNIQLASTTATNYGNPGVSELTGAVLGPSNPTFLKVRDPVTNAYLLTNNAGAPLQMQFGIRMSF